jgi:hypothetical protein
MSGWGTSYEDSDMKSDMELSIIMGFAEFELGFSNGASVMKLIPYSYI